MPDEILTDVYSVDGHFRKLWFPSDRADEIFNKTNEYFTNKGGTCNMSN